MHGTKDRPGGDGNIRLMLEAGRRYANWFIREGRSAFAE